jgi:RNA polymerase sigma factor (sigma-70 family)
MVSGSAVRRKREVNPEDFKRLLARFHADPAQAWQAYYTLRRKLVVFFEHSGNFEAEELAEEALDRIAKKADAFEIENVAEFAFGVARNLRREAFRERAAWKPMTDAAGDQLAVKGPDPEKTIIENIDANRNLKRLVKCLQQRLSASERRLLLEYYPTERENLESRRQELADSLGINLGALRTRMVRLREKLEECFDGLQTPAAGAGKRMK